MPSLRKERKLDDVEQGLVRRITGLRYEVRNPDTGTRRYREASDLTKELEIRLLMYRLRKAKAQRRKILIQCAVAATFTAVCALYALRGLWS